MGADMVGYLVKGPVKFTQEQIDNAVKAVFNQATDLAATGIMTCAECNDENDTRAQEYDHTCRNCGAELPDMFDDILETNYSLS